MKVNKNQALYRSLPGSWVTYSNSKKSDYKYACRILGWNTKDVSHINKDMIIEDIYRRVELFKLAGGDVREEFDYDNIKNFTFVKAAMNEGFPDIVCKIEPCTFYCQDCGTVLYKPDAKSLPICPHCKSKYNKTKYMNQLQMVYACSCGYADGVKPIGNEPLFYHNKDNDNQYKFFTLSGRPKQMIRQCPVCNEILTPSNATDSRNFYSQSGNIINLFDDKYSNLLKEYKSNAELLMIAKWFDVISHEDFLKILNDPKDFFELKGYKTDDPYVITLAKVMNKSVEDVVEGLNAAEMSTFNIVNVKDKIKEIISLDEISHKLNLITKDFIQYDILKHPKGFISLDSAIKNQLDLGEIEDSAYIYELLNQLNIKAMQISEAVEIVNYAYGFTRTKSCPDESGKQLRLRSFDGKVFTNILETEGILVELDLRKIYNWIVANNIVENDTLFENENDYKKWFIENINLDSISHFATIDGNGFNKVTKVVYSLIHTISHLMIISAGKHSGLSKDSISEIILPANGAFFIYPTSSEGVTLGSISGMFETQLLPFLEDALKENEICAFDPVCKNVQNGACIACTYLSEVNCCHFNKDLSRSYLYGGTIKINDDVIKIKKGFWK